MKTIFFLLKKNPFASSLSIGFIALSLLAPLESGLSDYALLIFAGQFMIGLGAFFIGRHKLMAGAFIACWLLGYSLQQQHDAWLGMAKKETSIQDTFSIAYVDLEETISTKRLVKQVALFKPDVLLLRSYDLEEQPQLNEILRKIYPYGSQLSNRRALFSRNALFVQNELQEEVVEVQHPHRHFSIATESTGFLLRRYRDWTARVQLQPREAATAWSGGFRYTTAFECLEWRPWLTTAKNTYLGFFQLKTDSVSQATVSKL